VLVALPGAGLTDEIARSPLRSSLLAAGLLGGLAGLIAAYTPRRAYATAAIIAVFIIRRSSWHHRVSRAGLREDRGLPVRPTSSTDERGDLQLGP
jgi:hypothetical protein